LYSTLNKILRDYTWLCVFLSQKQGKKLLSSKYKVRLFLQKNRADTRSLLYWN